MFDVGIDIFFRLRSFVYFTYNFCDIYTHTVIETGRARCRRRGLGENRARLISLHFFSRTQTRPIA